MVTGLGGGLLRVVVGAKGTGTLLDEAVGLDARGSIVYVAAGVVY